MTWCPNENSRHCENDPLKNVFITNCLCPIVPVVCYICIAHWLEMSRCCVDIKNVGNDRNTPSWPISKRTYVNELWMRIPDDQSLRPFFFFLGSPISFVFILNFEQLQVKFFYQKGKFKSVTSSLFVTLKFHRLSNSLHEIRSRCIMRWKLEKKNNGNNNNNDNARLS